MKQIAVLRHAKSRWDDRDLADFDRPLNDRGWKAARRMGREFNHRKFQFDFVLASPAARVRETIDGVQEEFDFAAPIRFEQGMYLASEVHLLGFLRTLPETVQRPLLVGHNPGLQQLVLSLSGNEEDDFQSRVSFKFPTAAFAIVELAAIEWTNVDPASGRITEFIVPSEL
jgi:phosphohistidine phosphatase